MRRLARLAGDLQAVRAARAAPAAEPLQESCASEALPVQEEHCFTYAELSAVCEELASSYPSLCRLSSIGTSREGRELWLLTLGDFSGLRSPEDRPAYFIYGNIHASEPTGAHAAIFNAAHILAESTTHQNPEGAPTLRAGTTGTGSPHPLRKARTPRMLQQKTEKGS